MDYTAAIPGIIVPQQVHREGPQQSTTPQPIRFMTNHIPGISLKMALAGNFNGLVNANSTVPYNQGKTSISVPMFFFASGLDIHP
ncbi:hypothetical protein BDW22DRAFT_1361977 [Trametopsis cervina]|nr:hypothetical protein BDW22DRAFT_1361977 [Trametopsis cervina]